MLECFYFDDGLKTTDKLGDIEAALQKRAPVWIDITDVSEMEADAVARIFGLHSLTKEDIVSDRVRVKVEEFDDYLFIVMYGIEKNRDIELVEADFVLGKNFLVTSHHVPLDGFDRLKKNSRKLHDMFSRGVEAVMCRLLDYEIDSYFPVLDEFEDMIEDINERVSVSHDASIAGEINRLKRKIIEIKKAVHPMREKISYLAKTEYEFISPSSVPYFRDVYDHMTEVAESVEYYRESIYNSFDTYMSISSHKMNETIKMLTIMATVMLPLSLIAGIYGTNFRILPGADSPHGFFEMIIIMAAIAGALFLYFRKKRWV